jgi:micrococcal nuclease
MVNNKLYHYIADVIKVYDGDTIRVNISLGFGMWMMNQSIRLLGINAPEIRGEQRSEGLISKEALEKRILGKRIILETKKDSSDKYGRWLGIIYLEEENINEWLIRESYAVSYM